MASDDKTKSSPERDQTDESLRTERERTDRALVQRQATLEKNADDVVLRARESADAILEAARDKADQQEGQDPPQGKAIAEQRLVEDSLLRGERALADATLQHERAESARALSRLLPLERDKTDRFLLTERSRSDNALSTRDDFLGIVTHDLRNLLGGIVLSASLLTDKSQGDDPGERIEAGTERIQRYAARMNSLICNLVDVVSMDVGKLAVTRSPADVPALVLEALDAFQAAAAGKKILLRAELADGIPQVALDHGRMMQVLANLITNAIKFTGPGGTILVRATYAAGQLELSVSDTGCGIAADTLEAIFERFWQVGKNDRRGLGLGLYISRCIVEEHGGKIWAESTPGQGSKLMLTIPGSAAPPT